MATTLAEVNEALGRESTAFGHLTTRISYAVGRNGRQNGYRGASGDKLHLLRVETAIADSSETPGWHEYNGKRFRVLTTGDNVAINGLCASNGQRTGIVVEGKDLADVTCQRCFRSRDSFIAVIAARKSA